MSMIRNRKWAIAAAAAAMVAASALAQTQVDLRTQSKSPDFSAASATKPAKTGTSLPAGCAVGELFFKTNAPAGQNLFGCTAVNTWSQQSTVGVPSTTGFTDRVLSNNGTTPDWRALGG